MPASDGKPAQSRTKVVGDYELFAKIGKGGMGSVYKARQISTGRTVAFKVLSPSYATRPDLVARFRREVRILLGLKHENIVEGIDSGSIGNLHYLAMEYVKGESVSDMLRREKRFDDRKTLRIMFDVARALAHAHSKELIHRDVKPENILLTAEGKIKLCDLGLAREQADTGFTMVGTKLGTPKYMSPEQVAGVKTIDGRADVYSLGATAYHTLTGRVPYEAPSDSGIMAAHVSGTLTPVRQVVPDANPRLAAAIERCLKKKPEDRYQTMAELCADLRLIAAGGFLEGPPSTIGPPEKAKVDAPPAIGPRASPESAGEAADKKRGPDVRGRVNKLPERRDVVRTSRRRTGAMLRAAILVLLLALIGAGVWALFWGPLKDYGDILKRRLAVGVVQNTFAPAARPGQRTSAARRARTPLPRARGLRWGRTSPSGTGSPRPTRRRRACGRIFRPLRPARPGRPSARRGRPGTPRC